jgi:hypothetical protein
MTRSVTFLAAASPCWAKEMRSASAPAMCDVRPVRADRSQARQSAMAGGTLTLLAPPPGRPESEHRSPGTGSSSREPGLPVPRLSQRKRDATVFYTVTTVGHNGRLADRSLIRNVHWAPGQRLSLDASSDTITAYAVPAGDHAITRDGFLLLPAAVRHRCDIGYRDQVFVAAYPNDQRLVVWTLSAVDHMVASRLSDHRGGTSDGHLS